MVACMAFFGFCVIYMLRVNLSVAIVAMTQNRTHTADDGTIAVVRNPTIFNIIRCTGSLGPWDDHLINQASDVPNIIFFHNFLQNSLQKSF